MRFRPNMGKHNLSVQEIKKLSLLPPNFEQKHISTRGELLAHIKAYFDYCITRDRIPTMTGLAKCLGITRRELLSAQTNDPDFNRVLELGKQTIVEHIEELMLTGRPPIGLIFWLKNNDDWIDKTTTEHQEKSIAQIMEDLEHQGRIINQSNPLNQITQPHDGVVEDN